MPKLTYTPENFGNYLGPNFTSSGEISFSWDELCRSAITVGRRHWIDVFRHGNYSFWEMSWRLNMIWASLVETPDGSLRKSAAYIHLDRSEKGAISFFLGNCFAKLVAEILLAVPWLLHLDAYRDYLNPEFLLDDRPDFVGEDDRGNWIIIEAKGRTAQLPKSLMDKAKQQTQSLRSIRGKLPTLRVAVATYFSNGILCLRIQDPEEYRENAIDLDISKESFARSYYKQIADCIKSLQPKKKVNKSGKSAFQIAALVGADADIGLDTRIYEWYLKDVASWDKVVKSLKPMPSILQEIEDMKMASGIEEPVGLITDPIRIIKEKERISITKNEGLDGTYLKLGQSWNQDLMIKEPQERKG